MKEIGGNNKLIRKIVQFVILLVGSLVSIKLLRYIMLPASNRSSFNSIMYSILTLIMATVIVWLLLKITKAEFKLNKLVIVELIVVCLVLVAVWVTSVPLFRAKTFYERLGTVTDLEEPLNDIANITQIRTVDRDTAINIATKKLGEISGLGSYSEIKDAYIQVYKGELTWVLPVSHKSLIKYLGNKEGTPAYVIVSATNSSDVEFVSELNGEPFKIKYHDDLYLTGANIRRYLYKNGVKDVYSSANFELDEEGVPHWVVTYVDMKIGVASPEPIKVVVCNAITGEFNEYSLEEVPEWVDRVYSENLVIRQIDYNGKYKHGFFNSLFAKKDYTETNADYLNFVLGEDGKTYWSTSISSNGSEESAIGYMLVNTRTKETFYYKEVGTTETGAMKSAQGKVQEKGYIASYPILYTINGVPTYVMSLKDSGELVKAFAFVNLVDVNLVAVEDTMQRAYTSYTSLLEESGNIPQIDLQTIPSATGIITDIQPVVREGNTVYYIKVRGKSETYKADISVSDELPFLKVEDMIHFRADDLLEILELEKN